LPGPIVDAGLRPLGGFLILFLGPDGVGRVGALRTGGKITSDRSLVGSVLLALVVALGQCGGGKAAQHQPGCNSDQFAAHSDLLCNYRNNAPRTTWFRGGVRTYLNLTPLGYRTAKRSADAIKDEIKTSRMP
jgi:hypothetical protein